MLLERFQFYLKHSINDLRVNPQRSIFGLFCIAAGVAAIVSLLTLGVMIEDTLSGSLQESNRGDIQLQPFGFEGDFEANERASERQSIVEGGAFTQAGLARIETWLSDWYDEHYPNQDDPFIVTYRENIDGSFVIKRDADEDEEDFAVAFPLIVDTSAFPLYGTVETDDGRLLRDVIDTDSYQDSEDALGDVVISENLASDINLEVGDIFAANFEEGTVDLVVRGIVDARTEGGLRNIQFGIFGYYYLDSEVRNMISALPEGYSHIYIKLNDPSIVDEVGTDLVSEFPFMEITTTTELKDENEELSSGITQLVSVMGLVSMLIGGIGIINTMLVVVRRRIGEVAVLKTLGLRPAEITWLFIVESILMGIIGSIFGILLGFVAVFALKGVAEAFLAQNLDFRVAPVPVVTGLIVGVLVTTIFGFLPILSAGQVRPATVLRPQDDVIPKAGRSRSFAALLVVIIAISIVAQGMMRGLLTGEDADSLERLSAYVITGFGFLIAVAMIFGGIGLNWTRNRIELRILRWVLLLVVLPIAGNLLGTRLSAAVIIGGVFIFAAILYAVLWLLIWLTGRFFTTVIDLPFNLIGRIIPRFRDFAPSNRFVDLKISLRAMLSTKSRGASMLLALVIGVFTLSLITMLVSSIKSAIEEQLVDVAGGDLFVFADSESGAFQQIEEKLDDGISGVQEYGFIRSYNVEFVSYSVNGSTEVIDEDHLHIINQNIDQVDEFVNTFDEFDARSVDANLPDVEFESGRQLTTSDLYKSVLVIPANDAITNIGLSVNDKVTLRFSSEDSEIEAEHTFTIVGLTTSDDFGGIGSRVYAPLEFVEESNGFAIPPRELVAVVNADEDKIRSVRNELNDIQGTFVLETRFVNDIINKVIEQFTNFPILVAALSLVTGGVVIANSVALSMMERRREIAIMKSVGLARRRVLGMLLMENGIMGFIGGLIGVGISTLILYLLLKYVFSSAIGTSIPYVTAFLLMGLCILIALVASMFSVFSAASEKPLNVLRYE